jgi:hypothetical protein
VCKALGVDASDVEFVPDALPAGTPRTLHDSPPKPPLDARASSTAARLGWAFLAMGVAAGVAAVAVRR